LWFRGVIDFS